MRYSHTVKMPDNEEVTSHYETFDELTRARWPNQLDKLKSKVRSFLQSLRRTENK